MNTNFSIGNVNIENGLIMAPVAGYTDVGFRALCYEYGAGLCFTEMVSAKGLCYKNPNTSALLETAPEEKIKAVQIFGSEEDILAQAVSSKELSKFDIIDINMGCPVPKVVKNAEGSFLMTAPDKVFNLVKAAVSASCGRPVTVKIRAGFTYNDKNAVEVALAAQEGGASAVTVHGRTRDQFYAGQADWGIIADVVSALKIPVIANGDVKDRESYREILKATGATGVMIARAALGRPYIFSELIGIPFKYDIIDAVKKHIAKLSFLPEAVMVNNMKKQIFYYIKGMKNHRRVKEAAFAATKTADLLDALNLL